MVTLLTGLVAAAAVAVTYFTCVRPHLRERRRDAERDRQLAELSEELRVLRARDSLAGERDF